MGPRITEALAKEAIAKAGLLREGKIRIHKKAHIALLEEMTRRGTEIAKTAGRLMRQDLRTTLMKRDIENAIRIIERDRKRRPGEQPDPAKRPRPTTGKPPQPTYSEIQPTERRS